MDALALIGFAAFCIGWFVLVLGDRITRRCERRGIISKPSFWQTVTPAIRLNALRRAAGDAEARAAIRAYVIGLSVGLTGLVLFLVITVFDGAGS